MQAERARARRRLAERTNKSHKRADEPGIINQSRAVAVELWSIRSRSLMSGWLSGVQVDWQQERD